MSTTLHADSTHTHTHTESHAHACILTHTHTFTHIGARPHECKYKLVNSHLHFRTIPCRTHLSSLASPFPFSSFFSKGFLNETDFSLLHSLLLSIPPSLFLSLPPCLYLSLSPPLNSFFVFFQMFN